MLRKFDGHAGSFEILVILLRRRKSFRSELGYDLRLDGETCSLTLNFLKDLGLIEDEPAPPSGDRRKRIIRLTAKGERVAKALVEVEKALKSR